MLAGYFTNYNATVSFTVNSSNIGGGFLASAWSNPFNSAFGFSPTVVQNLILTGNGVFFNGAFASAALGQNVPIFSPDPWDLGSSVHHTDDTFFNGIGHPVLIMNAATDPGAQVRSLSATEIGMLRDIGYADIIPEPTSWSLLLVLAAFGAAMWPRRFVRRA